MKNSLTLSVLIAGICLSLGSITNAQENLTGVHVLHEYLGDQCSFVPDLDIGFCCGAHDEDYAIGGGRLDRLQADRSFRQCIINEGRPIVAEIYYFGVRLFGWLFFNFN